MISLLKSFPVLLVLLIIFHIPVHAGPCVFCEKVKLRHAPVVQSIVSPASRFLQWINRRFGSNSRSFQDAVQFQSDEYTDQVMVFDDLYPAAKTHLLAIPQSHRWRHIYDIKANDQDLIMLRNLKQACVNEFKRRGINPQEAIYGFHVPPLISVWHLHLHCVHGKVIPEKQWKFDVSEKGRDAYMPFDVLLTTLEKLPEK